MQTRSLLIVAAALAFGLAAPSGAYAESKNKTVGGKSAGSTTSSAGAVQTRSKKGKTKPVISDIVVTKPVDKSSPK